MTQWHTKSTRKPSGGVRHTKNRCIKRLSWRGSPPTGTTAGSKDRVKCSRGIGGTMKQKLKTASVANVALKGGKTVKAKVLDVEQNPANRQFARQNVITKGATIAADIGGEKRYARVTSRPGQHGVVSAVLLEGKPAEKVRKAKKRGKVEKAEKEKDAEKAAEGKAAAEGGEEKKPEKEAKKEAEKGEGGQEKEHEVKGEAAEKAGEMQGEKSGEKAVEKGEGKEAEKGEKTGEEGKPEKEPAEGAEKEGEEGESKKGE